MQSNHLCFEKEACPPLFLLLDHLGLPLLLSLSASAALFGRTRQTAVIARGGLGSDRLKKKLKVM